MEDNIEKDKDLRGTPNCLDEEFDMGKETRPPDDAHGQNEDKLKPPDDSHVQDKNNNGHTIEPSTHTSSAYKEFRRTTDDQRTRQWENSCQGGRTDREIPTQRSGEGRRYGEIPTLRSRGGRRNANTGKDQEQHPKASKWYKE